MHSKIKGNIGQFYVAAKLAQMGFCVFTEEGDLSKVDIIAEKDGKLLRFQVKAATPKNGTLSLYLPKSAHGYKFRYDKSWLDYFALVDLSSGEVYFIESKVLDNRLTQFSIRLEETKNKQEAGTNRACNFKAEVVFKDYLD